MAPTGVHIARNRKKCLALRLSPFPTSSAGFRGSGVRRRNARTWASSVFLHGCFRLLRRPHKGIGRNGSYHSKSWVRRPGVLCHEREGSPHLSGNCFVGFGRGRGLWVGLTESLCQVEVFLLCVGRALQLRHCESQHLFG